MRVMQQKIGLGETVLGDEPDELRDSARAHRARSAGTLVAEAPTGVMVAARPRTSAPATAAPMASRLATPPRYRPDDRETSSSTT